MLIEPSSQGNAPAPYSGGSSPGADLFFVDGDFTDCEPCSMPVISYPFRGDVPVGINSIAMFDPVANAYVLAAPGTYPNSYTWSPNQSAIVLEQEFIVAQNAYVAMALNTRYNDTWALGWLGVIEFPSGPYPMALLRSTYLIEEGELQDIGGGLAKIRRRWASLPATRCEPEQYASTFPALDSTSGVSRPSITRNAMSRIQYDYFIFDDANVLAIPLFDINTNPNGQRLNLTTGFYPAGIIIQPFQAFDATAPVTSGGLFIGSPVESLDDVGGSVPAAQDYIDWATGGGSTGGLPAEICVESSTMTRWMGNIFERRTRFVLAQ